MFDTIFHAEMRKRMKIHYHEKGGKDRRMLRYYRAKYGDSLPPQDNMTVNEYLEVIKEYLKVMKDGKKEAKRKTKAISASKGRNQHGEQHNTQEEEKEQGTIEVNNK